MSILKRSLLLLNSSALPVLANALHQVAGRLAPSSAISLPQLHAMVSERMPPEAPEVTLDAVQSAVESMTDQFTVCRSDGASSWRVEKKVQQNNKQDTQRVVRLAGQLRRAIRALQPNSKRVTLKMCAAHARWTYDDYRTVVQHVLPRCRSATPDVRGISWTPTIRLRPKLVRRGVHMFVDADGLSLADVKRIEAALGVDGPRSTVVTVRQPETSAHTLQDVVAPHHVPSYMVVEKQAAFLRRSMPVVLKDVVYVCSAEKYDIYCEHVSASTQFPDCRVYVCCPQRMKRVGE